MPQVRADVTTQMGQLCAGRTQMQQVCSSRQHRCTNCVREEHRCGTWVLLADTEDASVCEKNTEATTVSRSAEKTVLLAAYLRVS